MKKGNNVLVLFEVILGPRPPERVSESSWTTLRTADLALQI